MNIGILNFKSPKESKTDGSQLPTALLVAAAESRGHTAIRLYEPNLLILDNGDILQDGKPLPPIDVVIVRAHFVEEPSLHVATLHAFRRAGYRLLNGDPRCFEVKSKLAQYVLLSEAGIPLPHWAIAQTTEQASLAAERFGYPVVLKVAFGTYGKGVFFAKDQETLLPITDYLSVRDGNPTIVQEFIKEARCCDLRVFVLGGKVLAAMERKAKSGDIRANASIGGSAVEAKLSEEERKLALATAKVFNMDFAGVDIIRTKRGPLLLEVNTNPGFEKLTEVSGVDVAGAMIEFAAGGRS